jgi:predicted RNA methylase
MAVLHRVAHLFRNRTPSEVLGLVALNVRHALRQFSPETKRLRARDQEFDRRFGTDTAGTRAVGAMTVPHGIAHMLHGYQAAHEDAVAAALRGLPVEPSTTTFIDYGSGKGRVLMLAALQGFRSVIGLEITPEMHAVALANVKAFAQHHPDLAARITPLCQDAMAYAPPHETLLCYFYNPCRGAVLRGMVEALETSFAAAPRLIRAIYLDPREPEAFEVSGVWRLERSDEMTRVYVLSA